MMCWVVDLATAGAASVWGQWIVKYRLKGSTIWNAQPKSSDNVWWKNLLVVRDEVWSKGPTGLEQTLVAMSRRIDCTWCMICCKTEGRLCL